LIIRRDFTRTLEARLQEPLGFIQVVLGPRQVGKTTGVRQILDDWRGPSHYASADEFPSATERWVVEQWERARRLPEGALLVIDEVQKVPRWSEAVKLLYDEDRADRRFNVVILGSASLSLQRGLGESLAGRYEIIPAHHWSLGECRSAFGWDLDTYLAFGGYPAAAELIGEPERWRRFVRDAIIEPVLMKDILGLSAVNKPALFRQVFELAVSYPAQEVTLQKMLGQLQDRGNVTTIKHYLELLEGAYLLCTLQKYTGSAIRTRGSSPKIIPLNTALVNASRSPGEMATNPEWYGRVFETAVGSALSRFADGLYYWRSGKDEVDFVVQVENRLYAVEVKSSAIRSRRGLDVFLREHRKTTPVVVDRTAGERLLDDPCKETFLAIAGEGTAV